jgi:hypothetical protein
MEFTFGRTRPAWWAGGVEWCGRMGPGQWVGNNPTGGPRLPPLTEHLPLRSPQFWCLAWVKLVMA